MTYESLGQPCRNFCIFRMTTIIDPKDGREKVVLSNFAAGATGNVIFIDPATGEGESLVLPTDEGAWAVLNWKNEKLLVGTCSRYGYLHALDLKTRTWAEPLRDEHEVYIWDLCIGSDGMVYGGTWPGCVLLRYDPENHTLENVGRVSDHPDNKYSRTVYGSIPGHILIVCGYASSHLTLWSIETRTATRFGKPGAQVKEITDRFICTVTDGTLDFYDTTTREPIHDDLSDQLTPTWTPIYSGTGPSITMSDGATLAQRGQEYYIVRPGVERPPLKPIPAEPPATNILTITSDSNGMIWGACGLGQTIFSYDPATGRDWNSQVVCDRGGEVYGMVFVDGKLFMSAYGGGDHIVYDPARPWDQINNVNPQTLESIAPALIRPFTKSVIGPDGNVWTGWSARYGAYGGGVSCVDTRTLRVTSWYDPIPEQSLIGLTADDRYLYFTTGGTANGLPTKVEPFFFVVWSTSGEIVWKEQFAAGVTLGKVAAVSGRVLVVVGTDIRVFNPGKMGFERSIGMEAPCQCMIPFRGDEAAAFCGSDLYLVNPLTGDRSHICDLPGPSQTATITPNGDFYFAHGTSLYRLHR